jgi:hypothetical protein
VNPLICVVYTYTPVAAATVLGVRAVVRRPAFDDDGRVRAGGSGRSSASSSPAPPLDGRAGSREQTGIVSGHLDLCVRLRRAWPPEPWPERIPGPLTPTERRDTTTPADNAL